MNRHPATLRSDPRQLLHAADVEGTAAYTACGRFAPASEFIDQEDVTAPADLEGLSVCDGCEAALRKLLEKAIR